VHGLGPSVEPVREVFRETIGYHPVEKQCFSACGSEQFTALLTALGRKQVLLAGVETHVCVYQTALDLLARGLEVHVIADAVSSRTPVNKDVALRRMTSEGARLSSTEMALFELTGASGTDQFRAIAKLVR
jgi:nicotinamidase-related amidase